MNQEKREQLKADLSKVGMAAITRDTWTAPTHLSLCGREMGLKETGSLDEEYTLENIANHPGAVSEEWGALDKVKPCVHDNASNMVLVNQQLLWWELVPWLAHSLQQAINDGFKSASMSRVVAACSRLVSHFLHSTVASNA